MTEIYENVSRTLDEISNEPAQLILPSDTEVYHRFVSRFNGYETINYIGH